MLGQNEEKRRLTSAISIVFQNVREKLLTSTTSMLWENKREKVVEEVPLHVSIWLVCHYSIALQAAILHIPGIPH